VFAEYCPEAFEMKFAAAGGITPGWIAAKKSNVECLRIIATAAPASLTIKPDEADIPIFSAIRNDNVECFRIIFEAAPEVVSKTNEFGTSVINEVIGREGDILELIVENATYFRMILEAAPDAVSRIHDNGNSLLYESIRRGKAENLDLVG